MHAIKCTYKKFINILTHIYYTYIAFRVNYLNANDFFPFIKLNSLKVEVKFIAATNLLQVTTYTLIAHAVNF